MERRNCFGTKEYSNTSGICRKCRYYRECAVVENKANGVIRNRTGWRYICPSCRSKDIDWFVLDKEFDKINDYIGKCNNCDYNIKLEDRKKTIAKEMKNDKNKFD